MPDAIAREAARALLPGYDDYQLTLRLGDRDGTGPGTRLSMRNPVPGRGQLPALRTPSPSARDTGPAPTALASRREPLDAGGRGACAAPGRVLRGTPAAARRLERRGRQVVA